MLKIVSIIAVILPTALQATEELYQQISPYGHNFKGLFPPLAEQNNQSEVVVRRSWVAVKRHIPNSFSEKIQYAEGFDNCDIGYSVGSVKHHIQRHKEMSDFTNSQAEHGLLNLIIKANNSFSDSMKLNNLRVSIALYGLR